jgi:hypothetical protein
MTETRGTSESTAASAALFQTTRDRDATATIRGFVYQVDITLLRWLTLPSTERLELECGEDIDRVRQLLSTDGNPPDRVFEAIKNRGVRITLRSVEALESLAGFCEHRIANPGLTLRFRYVTNCEIGREKTAVDETAVAGIQVWEDIRLSKYREDRTEEACAALQNHLLKARKPSKLNEDTWKTFLTFLATAKPNQFLEFVRSFEWSTRNPSATDMRDIVIDSIRSRRGGDRNNEQLYYNHLFVSVFALLSKPGTKVLDETALERAFEELRPDVDSEAIIARIRRFEEYFASRFDRIDGALADQSPKLDRIVDAVMALSRVGRESPQFAPEIALIFDIPPPETKLCLRREVVDGLATILESDAWLALSGGIGAGKTQLAILVAQRFWGTKVWLRLRALTYAEAQQRLDAAMSILCGEGAGRQQSIAALYTTVCDALPSDSLIVLDDVHTTGRDGLSDRLIMLSEACARSGVKLVTTSGEALPRALESRCEQVRQEATPPFATVEVKEFLTIQGCPEGELTDAHVRAIHLFSHGHPVLLAAIGRVLEEHHWKFDAVVFLDLLAGKLGSDLSASVQDWLLETVADESARNLLYRIRVVGAPFSDRELTAIAAVHPEIPAPIEKLSRLTGLWIQYDAESVYIASPLVQRLNDNNLTEQTRLGVHLSLAREVMRKRRLGPYDVLQAFLHFASARQLNEAAFVLLIALQGIASASGEIPEEFGLTAIWAEQDLPEEIDLGTRIFLRSSQAVIQLRRGMNPEYLLRDLDRLVDSAEGNDRLAVVGASGLIAIWLGKSEPVRATAYALKALVTLRSTAVPDNVFPDMSAKESYLLMLWLVAISIDLPSQLAGWLDALRALTPDERQGLYALEISHKASESIITAIWLRETERVETERDWTRVAHELSEISGTAQELGAESLYLQAERAIILISSQLFNDLAGAVRRADAILIRHSGRPQAEFLISEITARQLYFLGHDVESRPWWQRALVARSAAEPEPLVSALTIAGVANAGFDDVKTLDHLREAAQLAGGLPHSAWLTAVRAQGELAILLWNRQDFKTSYEIWARAAASLIANKDDSQDWKILFRIFGSSSTYFGRGFRENASDWNYIVPVSGVLLRRPEALASSYQAAQEWLLPASIAMFAWGVEKYLGAGEWARQAIAIGEDCCHDDRLFRGFRPTLLLHELPVLLKRSSPAELIDSLIKLRPGAPPTEDIPIVEEGAERELEIIARLSRMSADVAAFAAGLSTLQRALDDLSAATSYANSFAEKCSQIADTSSDFWLGCTRVFSDMFRSDQGWEALYETGKLHAMSNRTLLGALYYFAAMRVADAATALRLQLAVLRSVEITFSRMPVPYKDVYPLVVPAFVIKFWRTMFEAQPFRFGQIRFLRQQLDAVSKGETSTTIEMKSVIREIAGSLGANLGKEDRDWLLESSVS